MNGSYEDPVAKMKYCTNMKEKIFFIYFMDINFFYSFLNIFSLNLYHQSGLLADAVHISRLEYVNSVEVNPIESFLVGVNDIELNFVKYCRFR
jgi:hypothetical protein